MYVCNAAKGGSSHSHKKHVQKLVKFSRVVFELCEWTDKQTNRHTHHNALHPSEGKVMKSLFVMTYFNARTYISQMLWRNLVEKVSERFSLDELKSAEVR